MAETPFCSSSLKKALYGFGLSDVYIRFTEAERNHGTFPYNHKDQYIEIIFPKSDRDLVLKKLRKIKNYTIRVIRRKTKNNYFVVRITKLIPKKQRRRL